MKYRDPVDYYQSHGLTFDQNRPRELREKDWIDAWLEPHKVGAAILDVGCGAGDPIAKYIADHGYRLTGIDTTEAMLSLARARVPEAVFLQEDMRTFELDQTFDALIAWDSFFHLACEEQQQVLARFSRHLKPRATLLFNAGHDRGEAISRMYGEPLYHASLQPGEYADILSDLGFDVLRYAEQDPEVGWRTIWLAGREV